MPSILRTTALTAAWATLLTATPAMSPVLAGEYEPALTAKPDGNGIVMVEEFHPDGTLKLRRVDKDGKAHGLWQEWDEAGRPRYIGQWRDGLGEGVWTYFHPNGQIRYQAWVAKDIWHGPSEGWHPNGQLAFSGHYANGSKQAPFDHWSETGEWAGPTPQLVLGERQRLFADWPLDVNQWDFTFTPGLDTLFFATGNDDGSARRIMQRRWKDGTWSAPEPAPFADAAASEGTPIVSPDGAYVYFSSDRQRAGDPDNTHRELYRASRVSGWKDVERVTNTPLYGEVTLSLACDGRAVLWTDRRLDGSERMGLYEATLSEGRLEVGPSLNDLHTGDASNENYAAITPDGEAVVFANWNISGVTDEDLYLTRRTASGWSAPVPLGAPVNTAQGETSPYFTLDGRSLFYVGGAGEDRGYFGVSLETLDLAGLVAPADPQAPCALEHD